MQAYVTDMLPVLLVQAICALKGNGTIDMLRQYILDTFGYYVSNYDIMDVNTQEFIADLYYDGDMW